MTDPVRRDPGRSIAQADERFTAEAGRHGEIDVPTLIVWDATGKWIPAKMAPRLTAQIRVAPSRSSTVPAVSSRLSAESAFGPQRRYLPVGVAEFGQDLVGVGAEGWSGHRFGLVVAVDP